MDANANLSDHSDAAAKPKSISAADHSIGGIFASRQPPIDERRLAEWPSLGHYLSNRLAGETADATVMIDTDSGRSWKGLALRDKMLNVAAALIQRHKLEPGAAVCISYDHSDLSCILALGVICAGGLVACAYPKDPYPEVLHLARKVEPKLLFCHAANLPWARRLSQDLGYRVTGVAMDGDSFVADYLDHAERGESLAESLPVACADTKCHVALVSMSSGTTGRPKVIPATHWNCLAYLSTLSSRGRGLHFASSASLDYVSGRIIILGAIGVGYTAVIMNGAEVESYLRAIERYRISAIYLGAAAFYNMITSEALARYDISSVRVVFAMGAKITYADELRAFFARHPHIVQAKQGFGTSETSGCAINNMTPAQYVADPNNSGELFPSTEAKILDRDSGALLPANREGVLLVRSPTVFPGYYDCEAFRALASGAPSRLVRAKTINRLVADSPLADKVPLVCEPDTFDADGFYNTGDLAYFNDKQELIITGRFNERMTCRGNLKVIPQELEEVIGEHPAVHKVCVLGVAHKREAARHCPRAFVVPKRRFYDKCELELTGAEYQPATDEDRDLQFTGTNRVSTFPEERRRRLARDLMNYVNTQLAWEKQLTGGIAIVDDIPTAKSNGKMDKGYLRSLTSAQIELYGDRSE